MIRPTEWRPRRITDLVGRRNQATIKALQAAARERRPLAAALLGPIGTGKTSAARWLKASYNCLRPDPDTADACWLCKNCLRCNPEHNGEWLSYWTYELDGTQKLDREALSAIISDAREVSPHVPAFLFADEITRLDEASAQPVFLKYIEDRGEGVFLAAAMSDEGPTFKRLKIHPALFDRLEKHHFFHPEPQELVELLERLLPLWKIRSNADTLYQLVLRTRSSFRECLQKLELAQSINQGRMDRFFLNQVVATAITPFAAGSDPYADDTE